MGYKNFSKIKTVYFIGIGGIGTSAIARMFLLQGKKVSGSDMAEREVTIALRKAGAIIFIGENVRNIPANCDLVIYTIAIPKDHTELAEAKKRGIPVISYPEALGVISKDKCTIAITGTHGKTTTTAMVAKILIDAGLNPTVIVGSLIKDTAGNRTNFIAGKSEYLVMEACEYRRSFLYLSPKVLVITNIDADHLDYYKDLDDIESAFRELSAKVSKNGAVICDFSDERAPRAAVASRGRVIDFGGFLTKVPKLLVPGVHNKKNAAVALATADFLDIDLANAGKSLSRFSGASQRFEFRGKAKNGALVYDDYGHHPTEIEATLQGVRELFPTQKIVVVFQPHLYSRTKQHLTGFGKCFALADEVILLPIYPAREQNPGDINSEMVVAEIKKNGKSAYFLQTFAESARKATELAGATDVIITMGAGETNKVADILVSSK